VQVSVAVLSKVQAQNWQDRQWCGRVCRQAVARAGAQHIWQAGSGETQAVKHSGA